MKSKEFYEGCKGGGGWMFQFSTYVVITDNVFVFDHGVSLFIVFYWFICLASCKPMLYFVGRHICEVAKVGEVISPCLLSQLLCMFIFPHPHEKKKLFKTLTLEEKGSIYNYNLWL